MTPAHHPVRINLPRRFSFRQLAVDDPRIDTLKRYATNAIYDIDENKIESARRNLSLALELAPDLPDIWLFLAAIAETVQEQKELLQKVLVLEPNNMLATEALAHLQGEHPARHTASRQSGLEQNQVDFKEITCPQCKGRLYYRVDSQEVKCNFCGFLVLDADGLPRQPEPVQTSLAMGLLKRKHRPKDWNIGQWWLRCKNCGATTTLTRQTLTNTCRFCDSRQVVRQGVHAHFDEPDMILPFRITEEQARASLEDKLKSGIRALTRLWADPIKDIRLHGMYLPFWVFDGQATVRWSWTGAGEHGTYPILLDDILYFAAETPPQSLLDEIEPFDLKHAVAYDARLLATQPAELYSLDVDQASINVRSKIKRFAEQAIRRSSVSAPPNDYDFYGNRQSPGMFKTSFMTDYLTYSFALLPVWVGQLTEVDGDTRQIVVNGQTAKSALGKLKKGG